MLLTQLDRAHLFGQLPGQRLLVLDRGFSEAGRTTDLRPTVLEGAAREPVAGEHFWLGLNLRGYILGRRWDLPGVAREACLKLE